MLKYLNNVHTVQITGNKVGISLIILLKIDEYCSAEVADMSSSVNSLLTMDSNNPLHEYPKIIIIY